MPSPAQANGSGFHDITSAFAGMSLSEIDLYGLLATVLVFAAVILALRLLLPRLLRRASARMGMVYAESVWPAMLKLIYVLVVVLGIGVVLLQIIPATLQADLAPLVKEGMAVVAILLFAYGLIRANGALTAHYRRRFREAHDARAVYAGALRKIINAVIIVLGVMILLAQLGVAIGPLLASLGVAGIAVALALQDTLGNLFSGIYLAFDQPLRPGDYVQLDNGVEGFVEGIGWRNTRIRPWENNIIIVPNSKLSESIITNWYMPEPVMTFYIWCGVDYDSDLDLVEEVALEVAREILQTVEGANPNYEPVFRYKEFADSNVNFLVGLQVLDPVDNYRVGHEFRKALHRRFRERDIEISWPVRKVVFPGGNPPAPHGPPREL
jgi:small-conductance mechanosensitive channel